ncbi:MAG: hypothetical protein CVV27_00870 [Candidatus Melainabacteria bacterium HGW-Melainabacteria-1]|nr:MAG: hypothetical protein CVV27_00870 [Candidatus Melainabacteria bacterium HGW-Melainabacteria-1]
MNLPNFGLDSELTGEPLEQILSLLTQRCGTDFSTYKSPTLLRRIQHRQNLLNVPDHKAYLAWIRRRPQELDALFQTLLIGVTSFFRDSDVFAWIESWLQERVLSKDPAEPLRIWVPGCSTGEEAYTFAILLHRLRQSHRLSLPIQIFATDLDERALARARSGRYPESALKNLAPNLLESYFDRQQDDYQLLKSVRSLVTFSKHDLTVHPPFIHLDLISCRNLLIYFGSTVQLTLFPIFHFALRPNGLLLLGKSESVNAEQGLFEPLHSKFKVFRPHKLKQSAPRHFSRIPLPQAPGPPPIAPHPMDQTVYHMLAEIYEHPHVLVNEDFELLQVSGDVSAYLSLPQGKISRQLLALCRLELKLELKSLLLQAQYEMRCVSGLVQQLASPSGISHWVRLRVHPGLGLEPGQNQSLVVFEAQTPPAPPLQSEQPLNQALQRIAELEHERATYESRMKAHLAQLDVAQAQQEALNEELSAANQELHVSNEALASSNETLQATNQEMRVAYQELHATHASLEQKEQILLSTHTSLRALLDNTSLGFILLDQNLIVLKCNQQALSLHHTLCQRPLAEGLALDICLSKDLHDGLWPQLQQAMQTGLNQTFQYQQICDQKPACLHYDLLPVLAPELDQDTKALGIAISCQHISLADH